MTTLITNNSQAIKIALVVVALLTAIALMTLTGGAELAGNGTDFG